MIERLTTFGHILVVAMWVGAIVYGWDHVPAIYVGACAIAAVYGLNDVVRTWAKLGDK